MQSYRTKQIFTSLFALFLIIILISCTKETKKSPTKIYDNIENNELSKKSGNNATYGSSAEVYISPSEAQLKTIQNTEKNTSKYYLDNKVVSPSKTSAFTKEIGNSTLYSISSIDVTDGYIFNIFIPKGKSIIGKHSLSKNGNFLILNHTEDGLLTVYKTNKCSNKIGFVTIDQYNEQTISGSFETQVCNHGQIGERGYKLIPFCRFNEVQMARLNIK
ncbi:MAG: hypothetical protein ACI94Y_000885 [Maribacter sp.]|jgi:hypothetical protein